MIRLIVSTLLICIFLVLSIRCNHLIVGPNSTDLPTNVTSLTATPTLTPISTISLTPIVTVVPTLILTPTGVQTLTAWSTFTYNIGSPRISIDYPAGWNVEVLDFSTLSSLFWVQFFPPNDLRDKGVALVIDTFDNVADPRHRPNMGFWCPPPWVRLLEIPEVQDGFIYLVCPVGGDTSYTQLSAYYSSEKYRLKISITPGLYIDRTILQSPSITETITQQYGVYEHMMESVRLTEPQ